MLIANCEHPDGCQNLKDTTPYMCKDGTATVHYNKYCKPHRNRLSRYGNLGPVAIRPKGKAGDGTITPKGYRDLYLPSHPLATKNGKVLEHRVVLYDKLGSGQHPCYGCSKALVWNYNLVVDHLDFDKLNNNPDNLVPSCDSCNVKRFNRLIRYILSNGIIDKEILACL